MPVVDVLSTELLSRVSDITRITGIFNATSNYILSKMANGDALEDSLKDAQVYKASPRVQSIPPSFSMSRTEKKQKKAKQKMKKNSVGESQRPTRL